MPKKRPSINTLLKRDAAGEYGAQSNTIILDDDIDYTEPRF